MVERQGSWPAATPPPPPGGYARPPMPTPSGLFPGPTRPVYREAHPIAAGPVLAGVGGTLLWFALFGALGHSLVSYAWWTVVAAILAWVVAGVLTLLGDRGVAVGVALTAGVGLSIAAIFVAERWIATSHWPLW
jgi:hypothetical protein